MVFILAPSKIFGLDEWNKRERERERASYT